MRADIAQLAKAAMAGDVVVLPAFEREDFEDRLTRLNNGRSVGEIRLLRQSRRGSN
ncbi:hypothetical protein JNM87_02585 [Candidatus Saccharibacteria bacterium]|nr:hypothetical protein [Candidatus Saccharibacteria bacterium]